MRESSFPASDSARSHETDLEAGLGTGDRGAPVASIASSEASASGIGTANRGGPIQSSAPSEASAAGRGAANREGRTESSAPSEASATTQPGLGTLNRGGPVETSACSEASAAMQPGIRHGMVLPFLPVTLTFRHVHYFVNLSAVRSHIIVSEVRVHHAAGAQDFESPNARCYTPYACTHAVMSAVCI